MTPLRQHVIDDLRLIGRSKQTQRSYLCFISRFARYYRRCPSKLGTAHVRQFFLHLRRIGRKPEPLKGYHAALRFLYNIVLERPDVMAGVPKPKVPRRDHLPWLDKPITTRTVGRHGEAWVARMPSTCPSTTVASSGPTVTAVLRRFVGAWRGSLVASYEVLADLAKSRMKAQLGVLAVLHTWSNDLRHHPHVHCLVTAGGLSDKGWVHTHPTFLFPIRVMDELMRGKLLDALRRAHNSGQLHDPAGHCFESAVRKAYRQRWVVHVEAPKGRGVEQATKYLARYVRGVAISSRRILSMTATHVTFQTRRGPVTLPGVAFVQRFAQHILPRRFRQVRYYGLYATNLAQTRMVDAWRALMAAGNAMVVPEMLLTRLKEPVCPKCSGRLMELCLPDVQGTRPKKPPSSARGPP
ncbi:MAG: hypothetical protein ACI9MC_000559 [Kiritimatiellia bacterium]|jgi:hypothetical protein